MGNDSEKADKTWKQVVAYLVRFVLHLAAQFAILVSVLTPLLIPLIILSLELCKPNLFESPKEFTEYKQHIIVVIILLISVGLLSFLLQKYMKTDLKKADKTQEVDPSSVHLTLRLATWFMLIVIIVSALIPFIILFLSIESWNINVLNVLRDFDERIKNKSVSGLLERLIKFIENKKQLIAITSLLTSVGLLPFLLGKNIESIQASLSNIKEKTVKTLEVFWNTRLSKMEPGKSQRVTCCSVAEIWPFMRKTLTESGKITLYILILYIILIFGYKSVKILSEWQENVKDSLVGIRTVTDTIRTDTADLILLRSSGLSSAYLSGKGDTISLVYPPQGNLNSKKGICPEDDNLIWLKLFKQAILKCAEDRLKKQQPLKLKVQGFASAAPVLLNGDTTNSDSLNCEIANQRAEALIYFLTTEPYNSTKCKSALDNDGRWGREEGKPYARGRPDTLEWKDSSFTVTYADSPRVQWKRSHFIVTYKPWQNYDDMEKVKPVQDSLRLDLEFLNRSVQIIIEEGDCWTKSVDSIGQSVEIPEVQRKSFEQR